MSDRRKSRNQTLARILALIVAGVMTMTIVLAVVLK